MDRMADAIVRELQIRSSWLDNSQIQSIYFGGGTPSLLSMQQLTRIFHVLEKEFELRHCREITLEANPDDLSAAYLSFLKRETPVNRLSIGIQSFHERELQLMNRSHTAAEARESLHRASAAGFDRFNIDLIFGIPEQGLAAWQKNLEEVLAFNPDHLSCYALTIEEKTAFRRWIDTGRIAPVSEEESAEAFLYTHDYLSGKGYEHYEISNYARHGQYAVHNSSYWQGAPYLGIGPSAHSFDGRSRHFNVSNNMKYMQAIENGEIPAEVEVLEKRDAYNEYIMTGLRTKWGVHTSRISKQFPEYLEVFLNGIRPFEDRELLIEKDGHYRLTKQGMLLSDHIISELFVL